TRSHPHPSPSQTGSRAARLPPKPGRNFFWDIHRMADVRNPAAWHCSLQLDVLLLALAKDLASPQRAGEVPNETTHVHLAAWQRVGMAARCTCSAERQGLADGIHCPRA